MGNDVVEKTSGNGIYYGRKVHQLKNPLANCRADVRIVLVGGEAKLKLDIERALNKAECKFHVVMLSTSALRLHLQTDLLLFQMSKSMSGEQLQRLKERFPGVPILALVSSKEERLVLTALLAGACGCITIPVPRRELRKVIGKALSGGLVLNRNAENALLAAIHEAGMPSFGLTRREGEVLALLRKGASDKDIAEQLSISSGTVHAHTARLFKKLGVHNRKQAVSKYQYLCIQ